MRGNPEGPLRTRGLKNSLGFRFSNMLVHEDAESVLRIQPHAKGFEVDISRQGLKKPYRLVASKEALHGFADELLDVLEDEPSFAEVDGPTDGSLLLRAMILPVEGMPELMLLLQRQHVKGDEIEAELVRFASARQMGTFASELAEITA